MDQLVAASKERAKFVKEQREVRAWPQRQLAEVAGVNLRTIQRLERDGSASFETLMAVASAFEINVKELNPSARAKRESKLVAEDKPKKSVHHLARLTSGRDLAGVISGADRFIAEHDESDDPRAVKGMIGILQMLKRDIVRWTDADAAGRVKIEHELSLEVRNLENYGFYFFGIKRQAVHVAGKKQVPVSVCTIYMSHARSPKIIRDRSGNMVVPALLPDAL